MLALGIFLLVYGALCIFIAVLKPGFIWNLGKIQGFVKLMGNTGTTIFILVWGVVALGFGVWVTFWLA